MRLTRTAVRLGAVAAVTAISAAAAHAAFIVEARSPGKANANFSSAFPAANSTTAITSAGTTPALPSVRGSVTTADIDVYTFKYTPGVDADNTVFAAAQLLGNSIAADADGAGPGAPTYTIGSHGATGLAGGISGLYNVYFTTPASTNVAAAGSTFAITHDAGATTLNPVVQNDTGTGPDTDPGAAFVGGANSMWLRIATNVPLTAGTTYTVTQTSNNPADFVSQRAHGVMWEYVGPIIPEPTTLSLAGLGLLGLVAAGRRKAA